MQRILLSLMILWLTFLSASAADRKFPYDAVIDVEEEFVRSGNGRNYYPTSKLRRGDRVVVRRHDPGGWVMISPPAGSFSWIKAEYVHREQGTTGTLTQNNVIVRIGSNFNDDHDWYQRELSKGDTVEILGEKSFETDRGPVKMLKIQPPANEYRWIMGKALRPVDAPVRKPLREGDIAANSSEKLPAAFPDPESDPFDNGPLAKPEIHKQSPPRVQEPVAATESIRQTGPDPAEREQMRTRLAAVDDEFRTMIKQDPPTWNLVAMEQQYRQLENLSETPAFQTQLKLRLDAVQRYAKVKQEYDEFLRVATETRQRDAQLMSLKNPSGGVAGTGDMPKEAAQPATDRPLPGASPRRFDGAGVIQRSVSSIANAPHFVLTAPNGRMLAYLQPAPGVDLKPYVGQSMGVIGQRSYRQELQAELIVVRSLQPVRLKAGP